MTQSVKHLTHDLISHLNLRVVGSKLHIGLHAPLKQKNKQTKLYKNQNMK